MRTIRVLHLNLKAVYFEQIKSGQKLDEYRLVNDYWRKKLVNRQYDEIHIKSGYPKKTDSNRIVIRPWRGAITTRVKHDHFGNKTVDVFAIKVN